MTGPPTRERHRLQEPVAQNLDPAKSTSSVESLSAPGDSRSSMIRRRSWVYSLLRRCDSPPPRFGSAAWLDLEDGSAEKIAAVCVAAEAWASDGDNLADNLQRELDERRRLDKQHEDREYVARAAEHRKRYSNLRLVAAWNAPPPPTPRPLEEIGREYMARCEADRQARERRAGDPDAG